MQSVHCTARQTLYSVCTMVHFVKNLIIKERLMNWRIISLIVFSNLSYDYDQFSFLEKTYSASKMIFLKNDLCVYPFPHMEIAIRKRC